MNLLHIMLFLCGNGEYIICFVIGKMCVVLIHESKTVRWK